MPGYLDQYGVGEEQRNRIIIRTVIALVAIAIITALGLYIFENHHQESVVKTFLEALRRGDYETAYRDWGCTSEKPCSGYSYQNFLEDWGAKSSGSTPPVLTLSDSESCNNGVLLTVDISSSRRETLWVDRSSDAVSFAPYPNCPRKSPFAIMIHRTIGRLRKPLLK
jgi:hypothetical protein